MPNDRTTFGDRDPNEIKIRQLEDDVRKLRDLLTTWTTRNIDMRGKRVTNAMPSRNEHDYIIRRELDNKIEELRQFKPESRVVINDLKRYVLSYDVDRLNYGSLSLTNISIAKDGVQTSLANIPVDGLYVVAACVDETRITDTQNQILAAAIPGLSQTNNIAVVGLSPVGWVVGDYIVINNRGILGGLGLYSFEVFRIDEIVGPLVTLSRYDDNPGILTSWFGTPKSAHVGAFYAYRTEILNYNFGFKTGVFENPTSRTAYAERADIIVPNVCVIGITAALYNEDGYGIWTPKYLGTPFLSRQAWEGNNADSISPGLRTLNGAAYYISTNGTLAIGTESDFSIKPNEDSPVRCLWGYLNSAGVTTGAAATDAVITVEIIEVNETTLVETVIETVNFVSGAIVSGPALYPPESQQLPYNPDPNLINDNTNYTWPIPILDATRRYKTKITGVGADIAGSGLVMVLST